MRIPLTSALAILSLASVGCRSDMELAREALNQQADQNEAMATLQREVAVGARELVARDADASRRLAAVQAQLHEERAALSASWRELESNRRSDALTYRRESFLAALVRGGAATAAALFALSIIRSTFEGSSSQHDELTAMLLDYLTPASTDKIPSTLPAPAQTASLATFPQIAHRNSEPS